MFALRITSDRMRDSLKGEAALLAPVLLSRALARFIPSRTEQSPCLCSDDCLHAAAASQP